jgi:putative cell wall-binding protein
MYIKIKKLFILCLSFTVVLVAVSFQSVASASTLLEGSDRYATALKIVQAGWNSSDNAIIARGDDLADALAAAPLANAKGQAPILLTKPSKLPAGVLEELKTLGVKNIYIVGGTGAVSTTVENALKDFKVTRITGKNRVETSYNIALEAFPIAPTEVVLANGLAYADALSISAIAAVRGMPILLVTNNKLTENEESYIAGKTVYAVGGTDVLNPKIINAAKVIRLSGDNRYETNAEILKQFKPDYSKIYLANGTNAHLVDALTGSALAAKTNSPVVLVDANSKINSKLLAIIKANVSDDSTEVILGGTVAESAADAIESLKPSNKKGYVYNNELEIDLKVRAAPNTSATILGDLYNFEKIEFIDNEESNATGWYKINYKTSTGYVLGAYIQIYDSPSDDVVNIAKNISEQFEVGNSSQVAGNFDNQGLSLGYLQWNIAQGTLQPLLNRMDRQYQEEMKTIFGAKYDVIHEVITDYTSDEQLKWAISINDSNNQIMEPLKSQFEILTNSKNFKSIEADAEVYMVKQAMFICNDYDLKSVRGFALAFDIVLQNGSISSDATKAIDAVRSKTPNMTEKALLKVIANAVADSSSDSDDVRSRKMAIATGTGTVHEIMHDLDAKYGLSDKSFR